MRDSEILGLKLNNWPLPNDFLVELGRVAALWGSMEGALDLYVAKLAGFDRALDPRSYIILHHSPVSQKVDMLEALCDHLLPSCAHLKSFKAVVAQIRSAVTARNRLTHNGLALNEETGHVESARGTARGKLKVSVDNVSLVDVRRVAVEIHEALCALHSLVLKQSVHPRWRKKDT